MGKLTPKQRKFAEEYLVDLNATRAALAAGYSKKTAYSQGSRLLRNVEIAAVIAQRQEKRLAKAELKADEILREIRRLALSDIGEAFDDNGKLKSPRDMPEDIRRCIAGVESEELFEGVGRERERVGDVRKVKLWDKGQALGMAAKHLGLLVDRVEHEHSFKSHAELVAEAMLVVEAKKAGGA